MSILKINNFIYTLNLLKNIFESFHSTVAGQMLEAVTGQKSLSVRVLRIVTGELRSYYVKERIFGSHPHPFPSPH
jgi:hypothetical protein